MSRPGWRAEAKKTTKKWHFYLSGDGSSSCSALLVGSGWPFIAQLCIAHGFHSIATNF